MKSLYKKLIIGLIAVFNLNGLHAQTPIPVCGQTGGFTGMTRGYYFTAPTNFTICGIFVEDNMSTAFQSAAIVRFTAGAPPAYPGTTNNFVTLWQNLNYAPNNMIPVPNVAINAGDIIGIYGSRTANSVNSYGPAQCVINIQGFPTTTFRSGMQFDLAAGLGMHDIWNENNGSIGRVTMYTNCCPMPTAIPAINGPTTICEGNTATYTVAAQPGAVSYNWTVPAGATITSGQGTTTLNVTWNTTPGGQVCVDWTDACGTSPQTCINVTVNPEPTANVPANATYCPGDPVPAANFTSNPAGATYTWTNSNTAIGLAASGNGNTPAFTATNTGTTPITGTITVTPTLNGCTGNPVTYTITVNPTPPAPTAAGVTICPNNSATLTATAPGGNYEWYDAATGGNLLGSNASYTTPVLTNNTTYYVQTTVNGCVSPRTAVTVTIAPALVVNAGVDDTICDGVTYTFPVGGATMMVGDATDISASFTGACLYSAFTDYTPDDCGTGNSLGVTGKAVTASISYAFDNGFSVAGGISSPEDEILGDAADIYGLNAAYSGDGYGLALAYVTDDGGPGTETTTWGFQGYYSFDLADLSVGYESQESGGTDKTGYFVGLTFPEVGPGSVNVAAATTGLFDESTSEKMVYEASYSYPVNDAMTITPGIFIVEDTTDDTGVAVKASFAF